jgi:two-component system, cell cycle response regulator CpdR
MVQKPAISPLRVLYVEDNALVRELTCELLAAGSREVTAAATAEEALRAFKPGQFDIVLTDLSLPAMSGIEFVRLVQNIDPLVPVILISGYALAPEQFGLGPTVKALTKPVDPPELDSLIQALCPQPT